MTAEALKGAELGLEVRTVAGVVLRRESTGYEVHAYGTGSDYALGALFSAYSDPELDAVALAQHAIECAAEFDDCTGLPMTCNTVKLLRP